ncbi:hypothetical protein SH611_17320 [Geminicoccaceae bacterium 1502E]|nr:hypothetical protein [Geminicoccaceae bacterium 1502E]
MPPPLHVHIRRVIGPAVLALALLACGIETAAAEQRPVAGAGLRLGAKAMDRLRATAEDSAPVVDSYRKPDIRVSGGVGTGVAWLETDVFLGRFKRVSSPFVPGMSFWTFDEGVYVTRQGDRYAGRFHYFYEDTSGYGSDWPGPLPYDGRYMLVGSHIPADGPPASGIWAVEAGSRPHGFTPADQSYLASFEQRYHGQVARLREAQAGSSGGGLSFGQVLALGLGGLALVAADIPAVDAVEIGGALASDVLSGGQTSALAGVAAQKRQAAASGGQKAGAARSGGAVTDPNAAYRRETVRISCPSGVSNSIPLSYRTQQCKSAMIFFAETYACNRIDDMQRATARCTSACGNAQCRE